MTVGEFAAWLSTNLERDAATLETEAAALHDNACVHAKLLAEVFRHLAKRITEAAQ